MAEADPSWGAVEAELATEAYSLEQRVKVSTTHVRRELEHLKKQAASYDLSVLQARVGELHRQLYQIVSEATHDFYTPEDVAAWVAHAEALGAVFPRFPAGTLIDLIYYRQVPNARVRECYWQLRDKDPVRIGQAVHDHLWWMEKDDSADYGSVVFDKSVVPLTNEIEQILGLKAYGPSPSVRLFIPYEWGVAFAHVLGIEPHYAGV